MKYVSVTSSILLCCLLSACSLHPQSARTSSMDYFSSKNDWMNAYMAGDKDYGCVQYWFARTFGIGKNAYVIYLQNMVECGRHIDELQGTVGGHTAEKYERELSKYTGSAQPSALPAGNAPAPELVAEVPDDTVSSIAPAAGAAEGGVSAVPSAAQTSSLASSAESAGKTQSTGKQGAKKGTAKSAGTKKKGGKSTGPKKKSTTPAVPKKQERKPAEKQQGKTSAPVREERKYLD